MSGSLAGLSDSSIRASLAPYGPVPDAHLCEAVRTYIDILLRWNRRMSLTTVSAPEEILRFHIGESIAAISIADIRDGRLADVGSGAGFPGIPLAVFVPGLEVILIESNTKKAAFLSEAIRALSLANAHVFRGRYATLKTSPDSGLQFITARALGSYDDLLTWSASVLNWGGRAVLWLGAGDARQIAQVSKWAWCSPRGIVGTKSRVILVGQPRTSTH